MYYTSLRLGLSWHLGYTIARMGTHSQGGTWTPPMAFVQDLGGGSTPAPKPAISALIVTGYYNPQLEHLISLVGFDWSVINSIPILVLLVSP